MIKRTVRILAFILLLAGAAIAQTGNTTTIPGSGAASGTCGPLLFWVNYTNGDFYDCNAGAWNKVSGTGGGSGTVTSVIGTANQITSDGSTTTPTLSIPATFIAPGTISAATSIDATKLLGNLPAISGASLTSLPLCTTCAPLASPTFTGTLTLPVGSASASSIVYTGLNNTGISAHVAGDIDIFSNNNVASAPSILFYHWTGAAYQNSWQIVNAQSGGVSTAFTIQATAGINTLQNIILAGTAGTSAGPAITLGGDGGNNTKDFTATSGNQWGVAVGGPAAAGRVTFNPSSGTANFAGMMVNPTINTTSTYSGQSRILGSYPVLTSVTGSTVYLLGLGTSSAVGTGGTLTDKFTVDSTGNAKGSSYISTGTKFTTNNGCTDAATAGGAVAGTFTVGAAVTSCTEIITMGGASAVTAPTGWSCTAVDLTTLGDVTNPHQTATSTTTATIVTGTIVASDVIQFSCVGY